MLILVFLFSLGLTGTLFYLARSAKLLPTVRARDVHSTPKPRVGGVAMWLAVMASFLFVVNSTAPQLLDFGNPHYWGIDRALWGIIAGMTVILVVGLLDDLFSLSPFVQLGGQFLAAFSLVMAGIGVRYIRLPHNYDLRFDQIPIHLPHFLGGETIWLWSALFTIVWVVAMINVMNFFDGLDGLAGSVAMTAAAVLVFVSLRVGFLATATLAIILAGSAAGFLPWNWHPSKIFMGTVGSQLLGFTLGVIAIISGGKVATAVLVLGIPLFDAGIVILRRLAAGQSPFQADQRHLHHRLLKIGLSTPWVVIVINAVAVTFGVLALRTQQSTQKGLLTLLLALCMGLFILITYLLEQRSKKRVD